MEPKFQSSFIPKGPVAMAGPASSAYEKPKPSILSFIATLFFVMSIVAAGGAFGYDRYLLAHIGTLGTDLASARATMQPDTINELVKANQRIISTAGLLDKHTALTPLFDFLETATLRNVRYTNFLFQTSQDGVILSMQGQAQSYSDVARQSDAFNSAGFFKDPVFSDLDLDSKGNVTFTFRATLDPSIISYKKRLEGIALPPLVTATSTATTTQALKTTQATTTPKTASTTLQTKTATTTQKTASSTPH